MKHPEISRANDGGEENGRQGSVHDAFSQQLSTRLSSSELVQPEGQGTLRLALEEPETLSKIVESGSTSSGRGEETAM